MKNIKFFEEFGSDDFSQGEIHEGQEGREMNNYMFFQNLHTLKNAIEELLELDPNEVDRILADGHGWALDHIATSVDDVEEVYHFLDNTIEMGHYRDGDQPGEEEVETVQATLVGMEDNLDSEEEDEDE